MLETLPIPVTFNINILLIFRIFGSLHFYTYFFVGAFQTRNFSKIPKFGFFFNNFY